MTLTATAALLRVARRNVVRNRWRSVLVGLLIALPVAAMVAGITLWQTTTPTPEMEATWRMGSADLLVYAEPPLAAPSTERLRAALPAGAVVEPVTSGNGALVLPGRSVELNVRAADLEGLARGTLELVEGRLPRTLDEVAVSPSVAALAGVGLGGRVELAGSGGMSVVGLIVDPSRLSNRVVLMHPDLADGQLAGGATFWLVALPDGGLEADLGAPFDVQPRFSPRVSGNVTLAILVFGGLAMAETVLVGAAAFAVSIRRRQRELGLLAAVGASRRQLAASVVAEGFVIAGLGVALGLAGGLAIAGLASPSLDGLTDHRNPALVVDIVPLALACAIGLLAGIAAAAAPAWTAARVPVLMALSGRRPPGSSARRLLVTAVALIGTAVALTLAGSAMLIADSRNGFAPLLLAGCAILGVLGFGTCAPWLVERLEWIGARMPVSWRIALRDTARARSRTSPVLTAIMAGLAVAIAITAMAASSSRDFYSNWQPSIRADQMLLTGRPYELPQLAMQVIRDLGGIAAAPVPGRVIASDGSERYLGASVTAAGRAPMPGEEEGCADCRVFDISVASPEFLVALGVPADLSFVAPESVLLLVDEPLEAQSAALVVSGSTGLIRGEVVPARAVDVGAAANRSFQRFPNAYVAAETAARLGFALEGGNNGYILRLRRSVTAEDVESAAKMVGDAGHIEAALPPTDPNAAARLAAVLMGMLVALTITAISVALGESEARPDQRTLLALGADPCLRRRIVAARAGVIALLAAVLAVPAGLLPAWGLYAGRDQAFVVPVGEIAAILVLLPLVAIAGALLLARPIPEWSAFRDVAHE